MRFGTDSDLFYTSRYECFFFMRIGGNSTWASRHSFPTRDNIGKRRAQQLATVNAVQGLNSLAAGVDLDSVATPFGRLATASSAQLAVLEDVRAQVAGQPIPGTEFASEAALSALLRVDSCYSLSEGGSTTGNVVPFRAGEVSLPFGQESPIDCRTLHDGEALADILDVETRMKLSCEEREANFEKRAPKTYMDPAFVHSRKAYFWIFERPF